MIKFELKYLLMKNRISFDQLVKETNIDSSVLDYILYNRTTKIDTKVINKLCQYLDCDIDELINMDNEKVTEPAREVRISESISTYTYSNFIINMKEKGYVIDKDVDFIVIKLYSILTKILEEKYDESTDKLVSIYRGDQYITTYSFEAKSFISNTTTNCKIFNIDDEEVFEMFKEESSKYGFIIPDVVYFKDMISILFDSLIYIK